MAKKKKDFIRSGGVVAFKQKDFPDWWTVLCNDSDVDNVMQVSTYKAANDEATSLDNLIEVLNKIKKQGA